jgi:hypothetical protein
VGRAATLEHYSLQMSSPSWRPTNVDDDFRFAQFFPQALILALQFLILIVERAALGLGATLLRCQ